MDTTNHNRKAWDKKVEEGSRYTQCVSSEVIKKSQSGGTGQLLLRRRNLSLEIGFLNR